MWHVIGRPAKVILGCLAIVLMAFILVPARASGNNDPEVSTDAAISKTDLTAASSAENPAPVAMPLSPVRPEVRPVRLATVNPTATAPKVTRGPVTRLPIPRYVSLKGDNGNVRRGPSLSHRIDWVFRHSGMPLRVVGEFGHWRRIEDSDGAGGWIHYRLLSGVRTAIVQQDMVELRSRPDLNAGVVAMAEGGAIVKLGECQDHWCRISGSGAKGWVPKTTIWGVDPNEIRD